MTIFWANFSLIKLISEIKQNCQRRVLTKVRRRIAFMSAWSGLHNESAISESVKKIGALFESRSRWSSQLWSRQGSWPYIQNTWPLRPSFFQLGPPCAGFFLVQPLQKSGFKPRARQRPSFQGSVAAWRPPRRDVFRMLGTPTSVPSKWSH